jgi:methylisocitrate lyase
MTEAAGFAAIEIEDQIVPERAHHHVGIEHTIPTELMAARVEEAVAARRHRDFLVIARGGLAGLATVDIDELLAVERATVEKAKD